MNRELEEDLEKTIAAMPPPMQDAVIWAIRHFDVVKAFAEQDTMPDEQLDAFAEASLQQEDYILFIMAGYTKLWREKRVEKSEGNRFYPPSGQDGAVCTSNGIAARNEHQVQ